MNNVIIAFPKQEFALKIKRILTQNGYHVVSVCSTGAQAISAAGRLESGIIVCGYRFVDMMYSEVFEYLPKGFQMLMIASAQNVLEREVPNLVSLQMPLQVHELLRTMAMMDDSLTRYIRKQKRRPKTRSEEDIRIMEQAKNILQEKHGMTEEEAHRYIQKRSMDNGVGLVEIAQMIISLMGQ